MWGSIFGLARSLLARLHRVLSVGDNRSIYLTVVAVVESHTVEILTVVAAGGSHTVEILDQHSYKSLAKLF